MDRLCRPGRRAEQVLTLLASLEGVGDGGAISELDHALQLAYLYSGVHHPERVVV